MRELSKSIPLTKFSHEIGAKFYFKKLILYFLIGLFLSLCAHILIERQIAAGAVNYLQHSFRQSSAIEASEDLNGLYCSPSRHLKCSIRLVTNSGEIISQIPSIQHHSSNIRDITFRFKLTQYDPPLIAEMTLTPSIASAILSLALGSLIGFFFFLIYFSGDVSSRKNALILEVEKMQLKLKAESTQAELGALAAQVSHDIRSPLSALNIVLGQLSDLPEDHRLLIKNAIGRINDIANTMLEKSKTPKSIPNTNPLGFQNSSNNDTLSIELIPALIDELISEKRIQYKHLENITIEANYSKSYGAFSKVNQSEIKRALSNIINNAVESIEDRAGGFVLIEAIQNYPEKNVTINITDNGKGIPKNIIEKIGSRGISYGKSGGSSGSGLGLYHAKRTAESLSGHFILKSTEGAGTTVSISLPLCLPPEWFTKNIPLSNYLTIAVLDDDSFICAAWHEILAPYIEKNSSLNLYTFSKVTDFKNWHRTKQHNNFTNLYLIDYELRGQEQTGLEIIKELGIQEQSVLVTSRYQEIDLQTTCKDISLKILPKNMIHIVPIHLK